MKKAILVILLTFLVAFSSHSSKAFAENAATKNFRILVDQLIAQIDKQIQDRDKLAESIEELYEKINTTEKKTIDRKVREAQYAAIQNEALLTTDQMVQNPKQKARVGELLAYLHRVLARDQEIIANYETKAEKARFEYESQIAKIKDENTVLQNIKQDLEKLKKYPTSKEQAEFVYRSAKELFEALKTARDKEKPTN